MRKQFADGIAGPPWHRSAIDSSSAGTASAPDRIASIPIDRTRSLDPQTKGEAMKSKLSRRNLLKGAALVGSVVPLAKAGITQARSISGEMPWSEGANDAPDGARGNGYRFFTPAEAAFIEAAVARLIPSDDLGPGAIEAHVPFFIDRQLAGKYGRGQTWYMQGPWADGSDTQGYQSRLGPADYYRAAIKAIEAHAQKALGGKSFAQLTPQQQDDLLRQLEDGKIELDGVSAKEFFTLLWQNTQEGFFSDPIYGGNRDMVGWKMIGFPGARYDYREFVAHNGKRIELSPVGLKGRPGWNPHG